MTNEIVVGTKLLGEMPTKEFDSIILLDLFSSLTISWLRCRRLFLTKGGDVYLKSNNSNYFNVDNCINIFIRVRKQC